jgi:hypothetical protein
MLAWGFAGDEALAKHAIFGPVWSEINEAIEIQTT